MKRKPFAPTTEEMVQDAVANSRLSSYEVAEDGVVLLRIARGEMSTDQVEAWEDQQENHMVS
ncbi:antitoxin VbhA family protein [Sinorhizobium sp. GL28]|uniref:antitoxin VbhA family protein n=1 Tax=Sinorhizobium sp. GL28 TaxID=1358418 RepID=UPI00071C80C8|nr:antitoxin VbhA family protein [Sinorhizobium sp. GL28]KSV87572.1 hypothetical protein N184_30940 [Sinorhizobium sp. GL28]